MYDTMGDVTESVKEYLTFGRRPWRLVRIWILQVIILFSDLRVFRLVHPWLSDIFTEPLLLQIYSLVTVVSLVALYGFLYKMSQMTFAPKYQRRRHLAVSMAGYLALAGSVVGLLSLTPAPGVYPDVYGGLTVVEFVLGSMVTVNLSALLAIGFYAQFDDVGYPSQSEINATIDDWLEAMEWTDLPEGTREKEARYQEFQQLTEEVVELLEHADTREGERLQEEFEAWQEWCRQHGPLSQEAVIAGEVENDRLVRQRERLDEITTKLEYIVDP